MNNWKFSQFGKDSPQRIRVIALVLGYRLIGKNDNLDKFNIINERNTFRCSKEKGLIGIIKPPVIREVMNFPSWFPSGDKNVYETEDENDSSAIWVLNLDSNGEPSGEPQEIVKNYFTPAWSPDGNSIIVSDRDNLLLMSPSDGRIIKKFSTGIPKNAYPCYSDDGEKIVFCSYVNEDEVNIYIMNSDGSNVKRITSGKYDCNPSIY